MKYLHNIVNVVQTIAASYKSRQLRSANRSAWHL